MKEVETHHGTLPEEILFVGPDIEGRGGISSVLKSYARHYRPFNYLPTNSRHGHLAGYFNLLATLVRLPFERLRGRRILHVHYASGKSWLRKLIVVKLARALGFRTVMHCHCNITRSERMGGEDAMRRELGRADANIVLARAYEGYARATLGLEDTKIVNNIVERPCCEHTAVHTPLTFLFLGLLTPEKGLYDLLAAASILKKSGITPFKIIVGGTGDTSAFEAECRKLNVEELVDYRGWISGADKERAFTESDVLVLPSYSEAMPVSVLESMAAGIPAIATRVGAVPELIDDGASGRIIEVGKPEILAEAMRHYIEEPQAVLIEGAAALARSDAYTPEAVLTQLKRVYESIAK